MPSLKHLQNACKAIGDRTHNPQTYIRKFVERLKIDVLAFFF